MPFASVQHGFGSLGAETRLDTVPVRHVLDRSYLLQPVLPPPPPLPSYLNRPGYSSQRERLERTKWDANKRTAAAWQNLKKLTEAQAVAAVPAVVKRFGKENFLKMLRVWKKPTPKELEEIRLMDRFYRWAPWEPAKYPVGYSPARSGGFKLVDPPMPPARPGSGIVCAPPYVPKTTCTTSMEGGRYTRRCVTTQPPRYPTLQSRHRGDPFACLPAGKPALPFNNLLFRELMTYHYAGPPRVRKWGLDWTQTWGELKQETKNFATFEAAFAKYPFPSPPGWFPAYWILFVGSEIPKFVKEDRLLTDADVRKWITLTILQNYNKIGAAINKEMKERAKDAKRSAIIKAVVLSVASIVMAIAAPAMMALAFSAIQTAKGIREQKQAASDLQKAAKQFAATDSKFSAEIDRIAAEMDAEAAAAEAARPMDEEEKEAVVEAVAEARAAVSVFVEGREVARGLTVSQAEKTALEVSRPGQRIEFTVEGEPAGLYLRMTDKIERVPKGREAEIRAASPAQLQQLVAEAKGEFPWGLVAAAAAATLIL